MTRRAFNAKTADQGRLMQVLIAPQVSEKSTFVGEKSNQWIFRVRPDATKPRDQGRGGADVQGRSAGCADPQRHGQGNQALRPRGRAPARLEESVRAAQARAGDQLRARRQQVSSRQPLAENRYGTDQSQTHLTRPARRGQGGHARAAQGQARGEAHGEEVEAGGPEQSRPDHHAPPGRRASPALPDRGFPARQGRHCGQGGTPGVRPQPQRPSRAAVLRRWRAPLRHRGQGVDCRHAADERPGCSDQGRQHPAVAQRPGRHHHPLRGDAARQGRPDRARRGHVGAVAGAGRKLRAAAAALGRDPQGARRLPRHHRRGRQRREQPALDRQGRRPALARHPSDGARRGDEPHRPPARRRRGQDRHQARSGQPVGAVTPRATRRARTSGLRA